VALRLQPDGPIANFCDWKGSVMQKVLIFTFTLAAVFLGSAAYAQDTHGYVEGTTGFSTTSQATSGNASGEVGIRVAPAVVLFGNIGRLGDTRSSSLQASVDQAVNGLAASDLMVTGTSRAPAWYSLGGARIEFAKNSPVVPYVFGALGFARVSPSAKFVYVSGTSLSGADTTAGADVTSDVISNGWLTQPAQSTGLMLRMGGGVQIPLGRYLLGNVGYSISRISADTPVKAQDVTFGVGLRF
jgi:hypothetical protein